MEDPVKATRRRDRRVPKRTRRSLAQYSAVIWLRADENRRARCYLWPPPPSGFSAAGLVLSALPALLTRLPVLLALLAALLALFAALLALYGLISPVAAFASTPFAAGSVSTAAGPALAGKVPVSPTHACPLVLSIVLYDS
ncbi:MAG: hypothetical protein K0S10_1462 [Rubrobacteraceae bacterium]|nr:hypothetical protein [Rubrobacteraceae bacterium]